MNWYIEKEGICQGPLSEEEIVTRMTQRELSSDSLVWNAQMESWSTVAETKPEWLMMESAVSEATVSATIAAEATAPATRPVTAPLKPMREVPVKGAAPAPSRLKPQAPVSGDETKPGFFKRLFGGKK
jgi:hypothetical protein